MQSGLLQTINTLLQQFQQPQAPSSPPLPPELPSVTVNAVQQQLLQTIRAIGQNTPQQPGFNRLFQPSQQQQTPQAPCVPTSSSQLQLLSDALKMIAPVGQSPNDEQLLVMALHSGLSQGLDHRRAIETLHGVNNHAANLWKDYYLEHKPRIDDMLNQLQPIKIAKKPVRFDLVSKAEPTSPRIKSKEPRERSADARGLSFPSDSRSSRSNIIPHARGGSVPTTGVHRHRSTSRHPDSSIPRPPQIEPTPPTKVVKSARGNLYTAEDKEYFEKYISWALQADPLLTKNEIIAKLAENVPHHSAGSWNSYWLRDSLGDRLILTAQERAPEGYQDQDSTGDAEEEDDIRDDHELTEEASPHESDEDEAGIPGHGKIFGAAEMRVMAKHVARYDPDEWATMTGKQRWFPFHEEHPHRSEKAYGEKYRTKEKEFLRLAEQYRRRAERELEEQCGIPSWASGDRRKRRPSAHASPSKRFRYWE